MLQYLFALFGVLFSPIGLFVFLLGLMQFILGPVIPRITNQFHALARLHLWLGTGMLKRGAVVVTEQGDLLLKRMSPTGIGTEKISLDGETKEIEDPAHAKSSWHGIPFALVEGVHGFMFTPQHAAMGARKREHEEQSEMVAKATAPERELYDVLGWVRGVFEFPEGTYELPDLAMVRELVAGVERGEHPQRIKKFYEYSRDPYDTGTSATQFILLLVALIGPFMAIWLMASQSSTPTGTVGWGSSLMLALLVSGVGLTRDDLKKTGVALAVVLPLPLLFLLVFVLTSPLYAILLFIVMGMGFWFVPILTQILKISDKAAESIAPLLIKMGLMGYDTPIWELTNRGYRVREYSNLDSVSEERVTWHRLLGRTVGFTFTPTTESWDTEVVDRNELDARAVADGGPTTNIPAGHNRVPDRGRAVYGDFIPSKLKRGCYYIATGVGMSRIAKAARGNKSHQRLLQAKEQHGGEGGMSDRAMIISMSLLGGLSFILGVVLFVI